MSALAQYNKNKATTDKKKRTSLFGSNSQLLPFHERVKETAKKPLTRDNSYLDPKKVLSPENLEKITLITTPTKDPKVQIDVSTRQDKESKYGISFYTPPLYIESCMVTGVGKEGPYFNDNGHASNTFSITYKKGAPQKALADDPKIIEDQIEYFDLIQNLFKTLQKKTLEHPEIGPDIKLMCINAASKDLSNKYTTSADVIETDPQYREELDALILNYWSQEVKTPFDEKEYNVKTGFMKYYDNPRVFVKEKDESKPAETNPVETEVVEKSKGKVKKNTTKEKVIVAKVDVIPAVVTAPKSKKSNDIIDFMEKRGFKYNNLIYEDCNGNRIPNPDNVDESVLVQGSMARVRHTVYVSASKKGIKIVLQTGRPIHIFLQGDGVSASGFKDTSRAARAYDPKKKREEGDQVHYTDNNETDQHPSPPPPANGIQDPTAPPSSPKDQEEIEEIQTKVPEVPIQKGKKVEPPITNVKKQVLPVQNASIKRKQVESPTINAKKQKKAKDESEEEEAEEPEEGSQEEQGSGEEEEEQSGEEAEN